MKNKLIFTITLICMLTVFLTGCFDLGGFFTDHEASNEYKEINYKEYYSVYYDNFDDISLYKEDKSSKDYDLCDSFFNYYTVNKLTWEDNSYEVEYNNYLAMEIPFNNDTNTQSLALYLQMEKNDSNPEITSLELNAYILKVQNFDDDYIPKFNEDPYERDTNNAVKIDSNGEKILKEGYVDAKTNAIGSIKCTLVPGTWTSFTCKFSQQNNNYITVEDGEKLVIVFYNNTGFGNYNELKQCKFRCTNLLIRSVNGLSS